MPTVMFWNIKRKPLQATVAAIVREHQADFVVLAEQEVNDLEVLKALFEAEPDSYWSSTPDCQQSRKLRCYVRHDSKFWQPLREGKHYIAGRYCAAASRPFTIVAVHLPSKLNTKGEDQSLACRRLSDAIEMVERSAEDSRTIVIGDFNVNPFEEGMIGASGLHGVMCKEVASRVQRTVQGERKQFFYNPMWSLIGDDSKGPAGSFFRPGHGSEVAVFWNMYDQVLVRPALINALERGAVTLVQRVEEHDLTRNGRPNVSDYSDHLPLVLRLNGNRLRR